MFRFFSMNYNYFRIIPGREIPPPLGGAGRKGRPDFSRHAIVTRSKE